MMHFLTDTNVTSYEYIHKGWGVNSLLDKVASTDSSALIDTGALITGMLLSSCNVFIATWFEWEGWCSLLR